eukprot:CAMPEP_0185846620 /NCGR_PEP_ID=MMETSP1354-20130828/2188_1 /TAXON_ID=708628 /ORGANISM="Erythrolobus madagascarensis, Strain CCMP3276" /LENGTH=379 /DNA_ID=CAMNT_0028546779 /DNA_START=232 /DNA_END=1371 /DNA_ORIENTATION=-
MAARLSQRLSNAVKEGAQRMSSLRSNKGENKSVPQRAVLMESGYHMVDQLGSGGQGEVYRATDRNAGEDVAVKIISKASCRDPTALKAVEAEIDILQSVNHANVVRLIDVLEDTKAWYVITELLNGGDLYDRIQRGAFSEAQLVKFAEYTFSILKYLHTKGIAHRDLKLENFMLHVDNDTGVETIKLIDFGFAYRKKEGKKFVTDDHPGTLSYQAPEIVRQQPYRPEKVDVWCAGVMLYSAFEKAFPFYGANEREIERSILTSKPVFGCSGWKAAGIEFENVIASCLEKDQKRRPTAAQAHKKIVAILEKKCAMSPKHNPRNVNLSEKDTKIHRFGRSVTQMLRPNSSRRGGAGSSSNLNGNGSSRNILSSLSSKKLAA